MILKYINSRGKEIDFTGWLSKLKGANFSSYSWNYEGVEQRFGTTISQFKKDPTVYELTALFCGSEKIRKEKLNEFTSIVEYDVVRNTAGKLIHGDDYINCFVIASSNEPQEGNTSVQKTFSILAPYPFWIEEVSQTFFPVADGKATGFLDYDYEYKYDYTASATGSKIWNVDHYAPCRFKMMIYGPITNPRVLINGNIYEVQTRIESNEYLVIDSFTNQKQTITKVTNSGQRLNLLNARYKQSSVFTPISPENIKIDWSGQFGFDLTLFLERSEPKWT